MLILSQPYRAQGAAIAVEDAAVLGAILSHVSSLSQVPALLQAYQDLRYVPIRFSSSHKPLTQRKKKGYRARRQRKSPPG